MVVALDLSSNHVQYYAVDFYRSRVMRVQSWDLDRQGRGLFNVKYNSILTKLGIVVALDLSSNHVQYYAVDVYRSRAMRVQSWDLDRGEAFSM